MSTARLPIKINGMIVIRDYKVVAVEYETFDFEFQPYPTVAGGEDDMVVDIDGRLEFDADIVEGVRRLVTGNLEDVPWEAIRSDG